MFRVSLSRIFAAVVLLGGHAAAAEEWYEFRGAQGRSVSNGHPPIEFAGDQNTNVAWKTTLPGRAVNSPIVVGNKIITTSSSGNKQTRLHVFAVDDATGEIAWQRRLWATGRTLCHPLGAIAAPSPASDGKSVFALFSSNDLICLDLDGNVLWLRAFGLDYPLAFDDRGLASSPCVVDGTLVVQIGCSGDSFVFGLDTETGKTVWKLPLAKSTNWASPLRYKLAGKDMVMVQSAKELMLIEPKSGEIVQSYAAEGNLIPSPTVVDGTILLPADGMTALRFDVDAAEAEVRWQKANVGPGSASPVGNDGQFYVMRPPNVLTAVSIEDGSVTWKKRLKGSSFWATPLLTDTYLFVANSDGMIQVVNKNAGEVVAENELGEEVLGSPAASQDAIYWRSTSSLWKVET